MIAILLKPTIKDLLPLVKVLPDQWHKFGIEYRNVQKSSSGHVISGQLQDGRKFTLNHLTNRYQFIR